MIVHWISVKHTCSLRFETSSQFLFPLFSHFCIPLSAGIISLILTNKFSVLGRHRGNTEN